MFGTSLALLLVALTPRSSLANVLTKTNLRKAGGVDAASVGKEQPSELLLEEGPFNKRQVDGFDIEDVNLNDGGAAYGNMLKFHDESDQGEDEKGVSLTDSD